MSCSVERGSEQPAIFDDGLHTLGSDPAIEAIAPSFRPPITLLLRADVTVSAD
jgi:hypothetical protein